MKGTFPSKTIQKDNHNKQKHHKTPNSIDAVYTKFLVIGIAVDINRTAKKPTKAKQQKTKSMKKG